MRDRAAGIHPSSSQSWDSAYHAPALVGPVVELLGGSALVLDGTLGGGGHSAALLDAGVERVIGIDRDPDALATATERLAPAMAVGRFTVLRGNYAALDELPLDGLRFTGILLDLGISSHQIDDATRGFSFREGAPLDMRMGSDATRSAADLLNEADEGELMTIFREYGDEPRGGTTRARGRAPSRDAALRDERRLRGRDPRRRSARGRARPTSRASSRRCGSP